MDLARWFKKRYSRWVSPIDKDDPNLTVEEKKAAWERQVLENVSLRDGCKTAFGKQIVQIWIDRLHDIECIEVWRAKTWEEFTAVREERGAIKSLLRILGESEQNIRLLQKQIEEIGEESND